MYKRALKKGWDYLIQMMSPIENHLLLPIYTKPDTFENISVKNDHMQPVSWSFKARWESKKESSRDPALLNEL